MFELYRLTRNMAIPHLFFSGVYVVITLGYLCTLNITCCPKPSRCKSKTMAHINSFVRIPLLALRQRIRPLPRIGVLDEDRIRMRVWPTDIDFNFHLNNSRYLSFMDYGRVHMVAACGILDHAIRNRWMPLVGSVDITYRRSLDLFAAFEIRTRTLCWDEKWFYIEQSFHGQAGLASPSVSESLSQWNEITKQRLDRQPS
jgi:acyl-CoA thioesterase FadM